MTKRKTEIWSIFGQIEGIVAGAMAAEKKVTLIPRGQIPASALYNDMRVKAQFAIVIPATYIAEFNRRVASLRS